MGTKLKQTSVEFFEEEHRYELNGKELQGITSTLIPAIFGDYTQNIPEEKLKKAAERGTLIHQTIEMIDDLNTKATTREGKAYVSMRNKLGLECIASEYIVTDGEHFASPIDKVYDGGIIADIKTTSNLHYPEIRFQLSWYATYYQKLNKQAVKTAYVIWLPREQYGKPKMEEIELVDTALIEEIVAKYVAGEDVSVYAPRFGDDSPKTPVEVSDLPADVRKVVGSIVNYENQIKTFESNLKTMKAQREELGRVLLDYFYSTGENKIVMDGVVISRVEPSIRVSIDTKSLKEDHPEMYDKYKRETAVKETVRITLKKDKEDKQK